MLQPEQLSWPGVDRMRARAACAALRLAVLALIAGERYVGDFGAVTTHLRAARGYLGAVGFEKGGRL